MKIGKADGRRWTSDRETIPGPMRTLQKCRINRHVKRLQKRASWSEALSVMTPNISDLLLGHGTNLECGFEMFPVLWTIDPLDWKTENADQIVEKVMSEAKENAIILLHDRYEASVEAALRIVDLLKEQGYTFVTADKLVLE